MKEHRKSLQRRSRLLAGCRRWTVGFWGLRQYCFQRKHPSVLKRKKQSTWTLTSLKQFKLCRRTALWGQREETPIVQITSLKNQTFVQKRLKNSWCESGGQLAGAKEFFRKGLQGKLLNHHHGTGISVEACQGKHCGTEATVTASPGKEGHHTRNGEAQNNVNSHEVVVLNNSQRKCCCRGLQQNGTSGLLTVKGRPRFKQCTLKRRSLFMMYKKLSLVKFRIRVAKSHRKLWRGKTCKLNKRKLSWVEKVTRDRQEDLHRGTFAGSSRTLSPPWKSKSHCPWALLSLSDMNNHMPRTLIEESQTHRTDGCLTEDALLQCRDLLKKDCASRDQNGITETCLPELCAGASCRAETVHKEEKGEVPQPDECPGDIFISVMEKEISVSGLESAESNQAMGADEIVLEPAKVGLGPNDSFANGPVHVELLQNEDSRSQMEVEGSVNVDVIGAELLDHPYCKSPLDEPLRGSTGQKSGTPKSGKRSSQRASSVNDEQLAVWLCGFLDEVMKKYGSLVPLCEKDVMGRLKEVFNEDFSHRKPFITKEIMKYQTRHPKSSTCNFRVFYNKHMLDMDDLTTLDGQNWLNDQVVSDLWRPYHQMCRTPEFLTIGPAGCDFWDLKIKTSRGT